MGDLEGVVDRKTFDVFALLGLVELFRHLAGLFDCLRA